MSSVWTNDDAQLLVISMAPDVHGSAIYRSVTVAAAKSDSANTVGLKGQIPVDRKAESIFAGVKALTYALPKQCATFIIVIGTAEFLCNHAVHSLL